MPGFAVGFAVLVAINSTGWLPKPLTQAGSEFSRWCLVTAIAALGMKTRLGEIAEIGWKPVLLMVVATLFIAAVALGAVWAGWV